MVIYRREREICAAYIECKLNDFKASNTIIRNTSFHFCNYKPDFGWLEYYMMETHCIYQQLLGNNNKKTKRVGRLVINASCRSTALVVSLFNCSPDVSSLRRRVYIDIDNKKKKKNSGVFHNVYLH